MQHSKNVIAACFARKSSTYVFMYTRNLIIMKMFCSTQTKIALPCPYSLIVTIREQGDGDAIYSNRAIPQ